MTLPKQGTYRNGELSTLSKWDSSTADLDFILLPTPATSNAKGAPRNRYFGSPTYKSNLHEFLRDGESDPIYPNPELLERLMGFPTSYSELPH